MKHVGEAKVAPVPTDGGVKEGAGRGTETGRGAASFLRGGRCSHSARLDATDAGIQEMNKVVKLAINMRP